MKNETLLELWGGVECTVNRVGDRFLNQLSRNGHDARLDDLDRFASLGLSALRQPMLWELTAPADPLRREWPWHDERSSRLRELGIRPIAGLLHHGSGPKYTSLTDPGFPKLFSEYARAVAERYPWLDAYTPINEPLTTARFSCLYGLWYPHAQSDRLFVRAMLNQMKGTVLAMRAIREVNPAAQFIQTEDLGKIYSTQKIAYQASFENARRWLTFDLLCGHIQEGHPLWTYLLRWGAGEAELAWFAANACPPDIIGGNYYVTSERFLDDDYRRYPRHLVGGNRRDRYVDTEAVRVREQGMAGPAELLMEAWERYRIPLAITEAHLGCTHDEQLRWFEYCWRGAEQARSRGADVRAVTAWALLGSFDWNTLLTKQTDQYEPGAFDIRSAPPEETALATFLRFKAAGAAHNISALKIEGWWRRPERFVYGFSVREAEAAFPLPPRKIHAECAPSMPTRDATSLGLAVEAVAFAEEQGLQEERVAAD